VNEASQVPQNMKTLFGEVRDMKQKMDKVFEMLETLKEQKE
jgi:predicted nuclease with TOPRIM domain